MTHPPADAAPESLVILFLGATAAVLGLVTLYRLWGGNFSGLPYPPGPKGYPIIQNLFDIPLDDPWEGHAKLAKEYGTLSPHPSSLRD
ncbi:hypothetical protein NMY22_g19695 [Coprinellus aureogranulatus]|nr:hypothetical protein NMY22_g19695 [Coprinellus aureogranulatus]